jgi:hypothetical protein
MGDFNAYLQFEDYDAAKKDFFGLDDLWTERRDPPGPLWRADDLTVENPTVDVVGNINNLGSFTLTGDPGW